MTAIGASLAKKGRVATGSPCCQIAATDGVYRRGNQSHEDCHMFQIIRLALDDQGEVVARRPLQPLFELREDAMAMAEFDASRLWGDYGRDEERDCWWATDALGHKYRFVVESGACADIAA
jgi:hypothetical protein